MSRRPCVEVGQRFGMLVASEYVARGQWILKCDCGAFTKDSGTRLKNGRVSDCGCLSEVSRQELIRHMVTQRERLAQFEAGMVSPDGWEVITTAELAQLRANVADLSMMVSRCSARLKRLGSSELAGSALVLLQKLNLQGDPLRAEVA